MENFLLTLLFLGAMIIFFAVIFVIIPKQEADKDDTLSSGKIRSSYEEETAGDEEDDLPLTRITVYQDNGEILREVTGNFEIDDEGDTYVCYTDEYDKCHSIYAMSGFIFIDEV